MKITRNPVVGTWEKAESDSAMVRTSPINLIACTPNRILVVDDEDAIRRVFKLVLAQAIPQALIDLAANGAKGLEAFQLGHHSVILMDISMPVMDGEVAFQRIKEHCDNELWMMPSVIFCTGYNPSPALRSIVAGNAKHCMLQKPTRNQVLIETIKARLG